ncbi:hypothetical protein [Pseudomonas protegens]|uniref:hypothetical protein n=1 Tax=Pseudomonas protegens TaxID=380021 RepID=UPI0011B3E8F4|nr:hypothetical protein [Pseudomonas protegens]
MAYSILEFSGRFIRVHDLDLSIACFLVIEVGSGMASTFLDDVFEAWVDSICYDGPGCIDLRLDFYLTNKERESLIVSLIGEVARNLEFVSGFHPKDRLNAILVRTKIKLVEDYKVELIEEALIGLRGLIVGER